jgi:hypothetical protein
VLQYTRDLQKQLDFPFFRSVPRRYSDLSHKAGEFEIRTQCIVDKFIFFVVFRFVVVSISVDSYHYESATSSERVHRWPT